MLFRSCPANHRLAARLTRYRARVARDHLTRHDQDDAQDKKEHVPKQLVRSRQNMVDRQDLMIDEALDEVEPAPAVEHPTPQGSRAPDLTIISDDARIKETKPAKDCKPVDREKNATKTGRATRRE